MLRSRRWNYVILQPQSTEPLARPSQFAVGLQSLENAASRGGAESILYCPWGRALHDPYQLHRKFSWAGSDFFQMSYRLLKACRHFHRLSKVAPVGEFWTLSRRRNPKLTLHSSDGNHATLAGSYLAALTLVRSMYPSVRFKQCDSQPFQLSSADGAFLRSLFP